DDARPQRIARFGLASEGVGAHPAVAVRRLTVGEADGVHHAVAVEPVVTTAGREPGVGSVAEVDAVEVAWQLADHLEGLVVALLGDRRVHTGQVRVAGDLPGDGFLARVQIGGHARNLERCSDSVPRNWTPTLPW